MGFYYKLSAIEALVLNSALPLSEIVKLNDNNVFLCFVQVGYYVLNILLPTITGCPNDLRHSSSALATSSPWAMTYT